MLGQTGSLKKTQHTLKLKNIPVNERGIVLKNINLKPNDVSFCSLLTLCFRRSSIKISDEFPTHFTSVLKCWENPTHHITGLYRPTYIWILMPILTRSRLCHVLGKGQSLLCYVPKIAFRSDYIQCKKKVWSPWLINHFSEKWRETQIRGKPVCLMLCKQVVVLRGM